MTKEIKCLNSHVHGSQTFQVPLQSVETSGFIQLSKLLDVRLPHGAGRSMANLCPSGLAAGGQMGSPGASQTALASAEATESHL